MVATTYKSSYDSYSEKCAPQSLSAAPLAEGNPSFGSMFSFVFLSLSLTKKNHEDLISGLELVKT